MLALLSPAKKMNFETPDTNFSGGEPLFHKEAYQLAKQLNDLSFQKLKTLLPISDNLLKLNMDRYKNFELQPDKSSVRKALYAFSGDTYVGLDAQSFSDKEIMYADNSIRIISGLYGLLKPSDLIQPYRLEMGTKLNNEKGSDLYDFWRDLILKELNSILSNHKEKTIINLASKEYFNVVDVNNIDAKILDTDFLEEKDGVTKIISFFAKKARGAMANYIVKNKINNCQDLKGFNLHGYKFRPDLSSELKYVYSRSSAK